MTTKGPAWISVGADAQGYHTAPDKAGNAPSAGTVSDWIPAASDAVASSEPNIAERNALAARMLASSNG
jgi:hypothetical protein